MTVSISAPCAHRGWDGLREYVEREQPAYLLHGHTHPAEGELVEWLGATRIEYVYGTRLIELDLLHYERVLE